MQRKFLENTDRNNKFMLDLSGNITTNDKISSLSEHDKGEALSSNLINSSSVLTGLSHEMRTHMNAIVAFSFLMKEQCSDNPKGDEYSNQVFRSCEQLINLFDNFIDSAIIEINKSSSDQKLSKLNLAIEDIVAEFKESIQRVNYTNLELKTEFNIDNGANILLDTNKMSRILRSLFQNSLNHTKSGTITVGITHNEDILTFYVRDTANAYDKYKEFLECNNLNNSLTRFNDTQTAVNLTLVKQLVHVSEGKIWIERNDKTGTGIYFKLPFTNTSNRNININKYVDSLIAI